MIPFHTGTRVTGREFCGRKHQLADLREHMVSNGRVYLVGERRVGKTSLILEAARTLKQHRLIYADFLSVNTMSDVIQRLASAIIRAERNKSRILSILGGLSNLRPTISPDPITGAPTVSFSPAAGPQPDTLDRIFDLFEAAKQPIIVLDEFQDILRLKDHDVAVARLRGLIQHQEQSSFVFSGSVRNTMEEIFTSHDSPFYLAAVPMRVGPLDRTKFIPFLSAKFARDGRSLTRELLESILDLCHDNPGAVQHLCSALWQVTEPGQPLGAADLVGAWDRLFAILGDQFALTMQDLSAQQTQTLVALAKVGGRSGLNENLQQQTGIALQGSVQKALKGLVTKRVVIKDGREYRITDPFLKVWMLSRFGSANL